MDIASLESALAENRCAVLSELAIDRITEIKDETRARAGPNVAGVFEKSTPSVLDEAARFTPPPVRYQNWVRAVDPRSSRETPQFHAVRLKEDEKETNEAKIRKGWESKREVWMTVADFFNLLADAKASIVDRREEENNLREDADTLVYRRMASQLHPD